MEENLAQAVFETNSSTTDEISNEQSDIIADSVVENNENPENQITPDYTPIEKDNKLAITSFVLSFSPYLLILWYWLSYISDGGSFDQVRGIIWFPLLLLTLGIGLVLAMTSIILGIRGYHSEKRIFAYIGICLSIISFLLPLIIFELSSTLFK